VLKIGAMVMLGDDHIRLAAFVWQHQRLAEPFGRLGQDCCVGRDDEEAAGASRNRPPQEIGCNGCRLANADRSLAGDQRFIWAVMTASVVELAPQLVALPGSVAEPVHIGIERSKPLGPARFRPFGRRPAVIESGGVAVVRIDEAR